MNHVILSFKLPTWSLYTFKFWVTFSFLLCPLSTCTLTCQCHFIRYPQALSLLLFNGFFHFFIITVPDILKIWFYNKLNDLHNNLNIFKAGLSIVLLMKNSTAFIFKILGMSTFTENSIFFSIKIFWLEFPLPKLLSYHFQIFTHPNPHSFFL